MNSAEEDKSDQTDKADEATVRRLHPSSLLLQLVSVVRTFLVPALFVWLYSDEDSKWEAWLALGFVPVLIASVLQYVTMRYEFRPRELVVRKGLIFRSERQVPYDRIENVDLTRNPFHRLLGVAIVRLDTASGDDAEAVFRVLSMDAVDELLAQLEASTEQNVAIARARDRFVRMRSQTLQDGDEGASLDGDVAGDSGDAGDSGGAGDAGDAGDAQARPEGAESPSRTPTGAQHVHALGAGELIRLGVISNRGLLALAAVIGIATRFDAVEAWLRESALGSLFQLLAGESGVWMAVLGVAILVPALILLSVVWTYLRYHGYRLERDDASLLWSAGSWTQVRVSIPLARIQKVVVRQSPLHRLVGRAAMRIETIGGRGEEADTASGRSDFVPLCRLDTAMRIASVALPRTVWPTDYARLHPKAGARRMRGNLIGAPIVFGIALVFVPLVWACVVTFVLVVFGIVQDFGSVRWSGFALRSDAFYVRQGWIARKWIVVPHQNVQAVRLRDSPFDRRWGMATLELDSAGAGTWDPVEIEHIDGAQACALQGALAKRASA